MGGDRATAPALRIQIPENRGASAGRAALTLARKAGYHRHNQTGMTLMAETITNHRSPAGKAALSRSRSAKPVTVSASKLALHLDCGRTYIHKLEAEGVIQRQGDGFPLDASRVAYLRFLRRERKQSPRGEADADFQRAKAELIRLRIAEKRRELIPLEQTASDMEEMIGLFLTGLGSMPARCGGRDLAVRRAIDKAVFDLRVEIAETCTRLADERGEPPLDDDA